MVIDLGLDRSPPLPGARPGWSRQRLRASWGRRRRPVVAGIGVLAVLAVFAPDPAPAPSPLLQVAEREPAGEDFLILGDVLLIGRSSAVGEVVPTWSAHQLPTGDYRWSATAWPASTAPSAPILTVAAQPESAAARDPATGAVLWSVTGQVELVPEAGLAMVREDARLVRIPFAEPFEAQVVYLQLTMVDLATGRPRWSARSERGWEVVAGPSAVVTVDRDGTVEVRDPWSGEVRATAWMPDAVDALFHTVTPDAFVVVYQGGDVDALVHAYSLDSLSVRWQVEVPPPPDRGSELRPDRRAVQWRHPVRSGVLDLRTGEVVTVPGSRSWALVLDDVVVFGDTAERPREVVHRGTGRVIADLSGWWLVRPGDDRPGQLLLTHYGSGDTTLATVDLATGRLSYLGREPSLLSGCQAFDGGLVCSGNGRVSLWRWR